MSSEVKINKDKDIKSVVDHYLDYPYPLRNPEDEKKRLLQIHGEHLNELNHWLFKGKQTFNDGFRVLVAGGGTGDSSTYMGEQLKNKNAEVVYLDFSKNSMEIAKKRAENRGLNNITFINDSIFNIPDLNLGKFDYINCSGVLHHLSNPDEGLKILQQSLKPEGGCGVMVYAKYGRTAVYHIQELMRKVNDGVKSRADEVLNARKVLESLPLTNWYMRSQDLISDVRNYGDIGIYDLFLHKQDRCYSIPELYEFIEKADLNFVEFSEILPRLSLRVENFVKDSELLKRLKKKSVRKQHEIAEIMCGNIIKHTFYASNVKNATASIKDINNVPQIFGVANLMPQINEYLSGSSYEDGKNISMTINTPWVPSGLKITIPVSPLTKHFIKNMSDDVNKNSLGEIYEKVRSSVGKKIKDVELEKEADSIISLLTDSGIMILKDKSLV
jgi:2-polyprenyl-3-methyl-5-hydroxy-6-metoxy-1,4-benzoquinol methylase